MSRYLAQAGAASSPSGHDRLLDAMVDVAACHGYSAASVSRIVESAGVSRATFYQHFSDREDCFRAAYRRAADGLRSRLVTAARGQPASERPRLLLELILTAVAANPACSRLLLVESLAGPARLRAEHERFLAECAGCLEGRLWLVDSAPLQIPAPALLGAVVGVVSARLLAGEADSLPSLQRPLLAWIDSFRLGGGERPCSPAAWPRLGNRLLPPPLPDRAASRPLPRGPSALPPSRAVAALRERILLAAAPLIAARGYAAVTVAEIAAAARVSRRAFYGVFAGKQEVFLAAQAVALRESIGAAAAEYVLASSWPEAVWRACEAMCSYMAQHPDLTTLSISEIHAVGEPALRRHEQSRGAYALFLERGYSEFPPAPACREICTDAIAAATYSLLSMKVQAGEVRAVRTLVPAVAYVILTPFVGPREAMAFVEARARAVGSGHLKAPRRPLASAARG